MRPNIHIGNHPRVGVEIEISRWAEQTDEYGSSWDAIRNKKAAKLIEMGMMTDAPSLVPHDYAKKFHTYNCTCNGCQMWQTTETDPFPVQFALKYDGTLPLTGGEFISSPFTIDQMNWHSFLEGFLAITDTAIPDQHLPNKQGGTASPSIHVHASCKNEGNYNESIAEQFRWTFAPEILLLAGATDLEPRSLRYRNIRHMSKLDNPHHTYMNLTSMRKKNDGGYVTKNGGYVWVGPHIEIRIWEPDYSPQYMEAAVHCTAAIAQIMSSALVSKKLLGMAYMRPRSWDASTSPTGSKSFKTLVKEFVDRELYDVLRHAILSTTYVMHDPYASESVNWMFDNAAERWL